MDGESHQGCFDIGGFAGIWKVVGPRFMYQCERRCIKVQSMPISHAGAHKQTQNIMGSEGSEGRMAS
eukprot:scaffold67122_cov14-Tisochrysis_lutea.AAC.1